MTLKNGRSEILVAIIGLAGAIASALIAAYCTKQRVEAELRFIVEVFDAASSQGLPGVTVTLRSATTVLQDTTDSFGKHTFRLDASLSRAAARLHFEKVGYESHDQELMLPKAEDKIVIRLKPKARSPEPSPSLPVDPGPRTIVRVFGSGPKISGSGANFSPPYTLCSDPPPPGYTVSSHEFRLSGDRACGAWAECRPTTQNDAQVCWEFRLQGHNEWPPPGQGHSEGQLTVTFAR